MGYGTQSCAVAGMKQDVWLRSQRNTVLRACCQHGAIHLEPPQQSNIAASSAASTACAGMLSPTPAPDAHARITLPAKCGSMQRAGIMSPAPAPDAHARLALHAERGCMQRVERQPAAMQCCSSS
eukprot:352210-Chlamydomonas_euryale.AAC.11